MLSIVEEAKLKYERIRKEQNSPRFKRVIGKLIHLKIMRERPDIKALAGTIKLEDLLWAGELEPRILELLPALALKKPEAIEGLKDWPGDLASIVTALREGKPAGNFRHIPEAVYSRWLDLIGRKKRGPSVLKAFRFKNEDLVYLEAVKGFGYSETEAVKEGLKMLYRKLHSK